MIDKIVSDNSSRHLYIQCPRKYMLQQKMGLKGLYGSTALRYGTAWHSFLHGFYAEIMKNGWEAKDMAFMAGLVEAKNSFDKETSNALFNDDYRTMDNLQDSAYKYISVFADDEFSLKVLETEKVFELEMELDETDFANIPFLPEEVVFTGQIDLQVEMNGSQWIWEAKTTGGALSIESQRLHRIPQLMGYSYAAERILDFKPQGCLVSFHHLLSRKSSKDDSYGKVNIDFARIPHIFTAKDLLEWRNSFLTTCRDIALSESTMLWPMRQDNCFDFNRRCTYSSLCDYNREVGFDVAEDGSYEVDTVPEGFKVERWSVLDKGKEAQNA